MPNPFNKGQEPKVVEEINESDLIECEGRFGCYESGCGKVTGNALYHEENEILTFTCPDGHTNRLSIKI